MTMTTTPTTTVTDTATAPTARAIWMLNTLMVERVGAHDTDGAYSIIEQWVTPAGNPPMHVHEAEDEAFLVLEGNVDVTVDGVTTSVGPGGFAYGPRGVPHTYAVTSDVARLLVIVTPSGIEDFFFELGSPADSLTLPTPEAPDIASVVATAARHGITILPPPA